MSSDPWKDLSASLFRLHDVYYTDHVKMMSESDFWTPGSPAAVESAREPYAGIWGEAPTRDAVVGVMLPLAAALDHLTALATLLTSANTVYAPFTVARSAIEIAAQTWYQLEPGIGAEERAVRYVNSRLRSLWEQEQLPGEDPRPDAEAIRTTSRRRMDAIIDSARSHKLEARGRQNGRRPPAIGKGLKSTSMLADPCISETVPHLGALYWRVLSSTAHGQQHGLVQSFTKADPPAAPGTPGVSFGSLSLTVQQAALRTAGAPMACLSMLDRFYTHVGWDDGAFRTARHAALLTWSRIAGTTDPAMSA
ncbi:hypothetical protein ACFRDV_38730 [Streptomyces fagopyri]|uniref:hypothetical protein n=1 Tax=Streptomyces fagopyri TaxID=2662397 RepID=UPI00369FCA43